MKNKLTAITLALTAVLTLSFAAVAQVQKAPPANATGFKIVNTNFQCTPGSGSQDVVKTLRVTNTSGKTIPANTSVQFSTSDGERDARHFANAIAPGQQFTINTNQPKNGAYTCSAWVRGSL